MWMLKGSFLGLWLFAFGTLGFLYLAIFRGLHSNTAVGLSVLTYFTTANPWWWVALVSCVALGLALVHSWPGKGSTALWIVLLVTSVIPIGYLGLILFIWFKWKALSAPS